MFSEKTDSVAMFRRPVVGLVLILLAGLLVPSTYAKKKDKDAKEKQELAAPAKPHEPTEQDLRREIDTSKIQWPAPPEIARINLTWEMRTLPWDGQTHCTLVVDAPLAPAFTRGQRIAWISYVDLRWVGGAYDGYSDWSQFDYDKLSNGQTDIHTYWTFWGPAAPDGSYQTADKVRIELVTYPPRNNNSQNPGWQLLTWKEVTAPEQTC